MKSNKIIKFFNNQIFRLVIPLAFILFFLITLKRYVSVIDGPLEYLYGFPLPYTCKGWHTSLSRQYFISEMLIDFIVYFIVSYIIIFLSGRFIEGIKKSNFLSIGLWIICIFIFFSIFILSSSNDTYYLNIWFSYKLIKSDIITVFYFL